MIPKTHHVFISHSSRDKEAARHINQVLKQRGYITWFDDSDARSGKLISKQLEAGLQASSCVLFVCGNEEPDRWFEKEIELSLLFNNDNQGFSLIPVLLPGVNPKRLKPSLYITSYTQFHENLEEPEAWQKITKAINDAHPQPKPQTGGHYTPTYLTAFTFQESVFIGREEVLQQLADQLTGDTTTKKVALVQGLGGMGKTTLAQKFVRRYQQHYRHIIWAVVAAGVGEALGNDAVLFDRCDLPFDAQAKTGQRYQQLCKYLATLPGPNLLVLDNTQKDTLNPQELDLLPQNNWQTLATSRQHLPATTWHAIKLASLSPELAQKLFYTFYKGPKEDEALQNLLKYIGYHTLTTELLAKTLQKSRSIKTIAALYEAIQQGLDHGKLKRPIETLYDQAEIDEQGKTNVYATLLNAFQLADLTEGATLLLKRLAALPPEPIPESLLIDLHQYADLDEDTLGEYIDELHTTGWLMQPEPDTYQLHRLIAQLVPYQTKFTYTEAEPLIKAVNGLLDIDQAKDNPVDKFKWLPWGEVLVERFGQEKEEIVLRLFSRLSWLYEDFGQYHQAKAYGQKALDGALQLYEANHETIAEYRSNLALVLGNLGAYDEAKVQVEQALASEPVNIGADHPNVAISRSNLANVLGKLGEYGDAKTQLEQALESAILIFGKDDARVATCRSNLASVLCNLGAYDEAKEQLEKALASDLANFGEGHPNVAVDRSNLANVLRDLGEYDEAKAQSEKALASDLANFGADHPNVAVVYHSLAYVFWAMGQHGDAVAHEEKAYAIWLQALGAEHPHTQLAAKWLAHWKAEMGGGAG